MTWFSPLKEASCVGKTSFLIRLYSYEHSLKEAPKMAPKPCHWDLLLGYLVRQEMEWEKKVKLIVLPCEEYHPPYLSARTGTERVAKNTKANWFDFWNTKEEGGLGCEGDLHWSKCIWLSKMGEGHLSQIKSSIEHNGDRKSFHVTLFFLSFNSHWFSIFLCSWLGARDSRTASYMAKVFKRVPCLLILLEKWLWLLV